MSELTAYVDGSHDKNTGMFGYGVVILSDDRYVTEMNGYGKDEDGIWNVAGELAGVRAAIRYALSQGCTELRICYDYEGIEKWATGAWKAKKPATQEYVRYIRGEVASRGLTLTFAKVKAHSGVLYNERADELAKQGVEEANKALADTQMCESGEKKQWETPTVETSPEKSAGQEETIVLTLEEEVFLERFCNPALKEEARKAYITLMKLKGIIK